MYIIDPKTGKLSRLVWNEEDSIYDYIPLTEQELNARENKPDHTTMKTIDDEEDDASFLTDVGRVGFSTLEAVPNVFSDFVVRPLATGVFDVEEQDYDDGYNKLVSGAAEYVPGLEREDIVDPETGKILRPETGAGMILDIGTYLVGGGVVFKTLNKLSKSQKASAIGKKLGVKGPGMVTKAVISEQTIEQLLSDPDSNLANFVAEDLMEDPPAVLEYLAADKDDSVLLNRAKLAITSGFITAGVAGLLKMGFKTYDITRHSQKVLGKRAPENAAEADQVVRRLLDEERKRQLKNPSETIKKLRKVKQDDAEGVAQMINQSKGGITGALSWVKQRWFTARGFYSEQAYEAGQASIQTQRQLQSHAFNIGRRLNRFMDDAVSKGDKKVVDNVIKALSDKNYKNLKPNEIIKYLTSKYKFSKEIANEVKDARGAIDILSKELKNSSIGTEVINEAIEGNMGEYIRRSYRLFEDAGWTPNNDLIKKAKDAIYDKELSKIVGKNKKYAEEAEVPAEILIKFQKQANTDVTKIINKGDRADFNDYVSRIRRVNKKYLTERKDIMPEIRALMGEIKDPGENIVLTVQKLSSLIENNKFYTKLNELGGSVASNTKAYDDSLRLARLELKAKDVDLMNETKGRFVTMVDDGSVGKIIKEKDGVYTIQTKDFKTRLSSEKDFDSSAFEVIPRDKTLSKLTQKIYDTKTGGKAYTDEKYIFEDADDIFTTEIKGTGSVLDGKFTTPELARAINNLEDTHMLWGFFSKGAKNNELVQWFAGAKGLNQQMRTVYDHTTHLRNALGGFQFGLANGINPLKNGRLNFQVLLNQIDGGVDNRVFDAYYEKLQGLGVINTAVRASEARALIDIMGESVVSSRVGNKLRKLSEKYPSMERPKELGTLLKQKPEQVYMATDDFFKMNAFANELDTLRKAYKGNKSWTTDRLEKEAARKVKDTMPNYDRVSKGIKALREMPVGNFVAFPAEIIRTSVHIVEEGLKEAFSGNTVLAIRGFQRLAGISTMGFGWTALGHYSNHLMGFNEVENKGLQTNAEGFTLNHNKQFLRGKDGEMYVHDPTYLNSYNIFQDIALGFHRELALGKLSGKAAHERLINGTIEALRAITQPFTDEAMFTSMLGDIAHAFSDEQGRNAKGRQIFKDKDDIGESVYDAMEYISTSFAPGFVLDGKKYAEAVFETPNADTGLKRSLSARTVEMLSGINYRKYKPEDNFAFHVKKYNRVKNYEIPKIKAKFGKSSEEYFKEYTQGQAKKYAAAQELFRQIEAMRDLGFGSTDIYYMMKRAGLTSTSDIYSFMRGTFNPDSLSFSKEYNMLLKSGDREEARDFNYKLQNYIEFIAGTKLQPVEEEDITSSKIIREQISLRDLERLDLAKGGIVLDVPKASKEPDERIDKMTGRPYDEQAGEAFEDVEDRFKDPLERLGLAGGGIVDPLERLGFKGGGIVDPLVRLGFTGGGAVDPLERLGFASGSSVYKIKSGDTLSEIAEEQGVSQAELQRINKIEDPDRIFAGAEIIIPAEEEPVEVAPEITPEITPEFTQEDTANLAAGMIQELVASDRDLEEELAVEQRRGKSFGFFPEAQAATLESPPEAPEDYSGVWGGGMRQLHHSLNQTKKDLDAGRITQLEAGIREFGARIDMAFAPIGELVGTVASAVTPDIIEDPVKGKVGEMVQEVAEFLEENPGWKRSAKNVNALVSILGIVPAAQILKTGTNMFAAGTKQKLNNFYNVKKGVKFKTVTALDEAGNKIKVQKEIPVTRPFVNKAERVASQTKAAGFAFMQAVPEAVVDALVPGMMARRGAGVAGSKRKEILEAGKYIDIGAGDHFAAVVGARNIIDQSPNLDRGKLIKDGSIERAYVHGTVKMSNKKKVKASLFNDYNDFLIPEAIQKRAMRHLYAGPWTEGIGINVRGRKISSERPLNPKNTDIDIKRLDGPQKLIHESHADFDTAANSLRKLFKESNRIKIAKYVNQLNPDGTIKSGVKLNKEGKITKASLKVNRNKGVDVDKALNNITPEQIKSWLAFDAGGKQGAGVKFKSDPKNSDIIYWSDTHTSKSKESGGVNNFIAMDFKTKDVYVMVSDKHDILANLNPIGGSSRLTVSPMTKRNFGDINKRGEHTQRDFQGEAQAALDMLKKENMGLPEGGLSIPQYDPIIGVIPIGTKTESVIGGAKTTLDDLKKIAKAKDVEKRKDGWYVDGEKMAKEKLDGAVNVNATVLAHYSGKATAADYGTLVRRVGKIYSATAGGGESMPSAARAGLYSGGKVFSALKRVS